MGKFKWFRRVPTDLKAAWKAFREPPERPDSRQSVQLRLREEAVELITRGNRIRSIAAEAQVEFAGHPEEEVQKALRRIETLAEETTQRIDRIKELIIEVEAGSTYRGVVGDLASFPPEKRQAGAELLAERARTLRAAYEPEPATADYLLLLSKRDNLLLELIGTEGSAREEIQRKIDECESLVHAAQDAHRRQRDDRVRGIEREFAERMRKFKNGL